MRLIEERRTVIGPGAIVRLSKNAANGSVKELMARWCVLGVEDELVRVEDVEDAEDLRTFRLEDLERVKGGVEKVVGLIPEGAATAEPWPEHDRWPACMFDDPEDLLEDEEDEAE